MTDWEIPPQGDQGTSIPAPSLVTQALLSFTRRGSAARVPRANLHPFSEVGVAADGSSQTLLVELEIQATALGSVSNQY